jgi:hypothetical protein
MTTEIKYHRGSYGEPIKVIAWRTEEPDQEGLFAMDLVRTYGLITGKVGGREDGARRAVMDNMPVDEVVARAFDLAAATFAALKDRGLMISILPYEDALAAARKDSERN